ncbi:hypothetical protein ACFQDN_21785 [Pseudomonas asuensis]
MKTGLQGNFKRSPNDPLVNAEIRLAVIKLGMPKDHLHRFNIACSSPHFSRQ